MAEAGEIAVLTQQLARDPSSLVFLALGEALRRAGDLDGALPVAESGVAWYPEMSGAWDLLGRIRSDRGEGDLAFDAWTTVLRLDPEHPGAHKGLGFLAFRAGELDRSLRHLRKALQCSPGDIALRTVLERVAAEAARREPEPPSPSPLARAEIAGRAVLVDLTGRHLDGRLDPPLGPFEAAAVGSALAALSRDAERTARLLELGPWRRLSLSGEALQVEVRSPTIDSLLLYTTPVAAPEVGDFAPGDAADRLASRTGQWMEALR